MNKKSFNLQIKGEKDKIDNILKFLKIRLSSKEKRKVFHAEIVYLALIKLAKDLVEE